MYAEYFKLSEPPFSLTPDPRFLFVSERHREGLAHLLYGVQQAGGFVQLTGEVGCGKTTLCRSLVKQLPPETDIALILNPRLTALELLATVCDELRIAYPAGVDSIKTLIDALNRHLLESHARHGRTVLIIDEAQNLSADVLEQIRLLTNLETTKDKLLQVILIGQPELLSVLRRKELRQLAQRITARYHLLPLSRRDTHAYIRHRLSVAGRKDPLLTNAAMRQVYHFSGGVPRLINIICDRALLGAYSLDRQNVTAPIVRKAGREASGIVPWYRWPRPVWTAGFAAFAVLFVGIAIFLAVSGPPALRRTAAPAAVTDSSGGAGAAIPGASPAVAATDRPKAETVAAQFNSGAGQPQYRLADILSNPSLRGNSDSSFMTLFAYWGVRLPPGSWDPGCPAGRELGFECLSQHGGWPKLRRLDLPAILELVLPNGLRHPATLAALKDDSATLAIGEAEYNFPIQEIDRVWDGSFIAIWKPPFTRRELSLGARGAEVKWIRQTLDTLEGRPVNRAVSDLYDESLRRRVTDYQRDRSLIPDGFVGSETLVRLTAELGKKHSPSISRRVPRG